MRWRVSLRLLAVAEELFRLLEQTKNDGGIAFTL